MTARLIAFALLGGLGVAAQTPSAESGTVLVSLIDRPVGRETYSIWPDPDGVTFTGDLDLTERGGRLQIASSLRATSDLTPVEFTVKGRSYRFVNVDAAVKVAGGMATVTNLESATRVPAESMGLSKDSGTIEAGKRADLIVLNADPLSQISNIRKLRWVVADGRILEPAKLWSAAGFK